MSWQAYIDNMTSQGIPLCGIYVKDSGQPCAQSAGMDVKPQEVEYIRNCLAGKEFKLEVNGQPCVMTKSEEGYVEGKTKALCHNNEKVFFHCEMTNQYIVIAGKNGAGERDASNIGNKIAGHLKGSGN